tara:strand:- start:486 stop:836 length:351 start_codon:yes stop_codon:yes gene_type:complete
MACITKVAQLVSMTDRELLALRSFGRTSLREIKRKLEDLSLSLGMQLPPGVDGTIVMEDCGENASFELGEESSMDDADFIIGEADVETEVVATDNLEVTEEASTDELIGGSEEGTE